KGASATIGHRVDLRATPENASPLDIAVPLLKPRRRAKTHAVGLEKRLRRVVPFRGNRVGPFPGNRVVPFLGNQGGPFPGNPAHGSVDSRSAIQATSFTYVLRSAHSG